MKLTFYIVLKVNVFLAYKVYLIIPYNSDITFVSPECFWQSWAGKTGK